jgi:hypothetical protein
LYLQQYRAKKIDAAKGHYVILLHVHSEKEEIDRVGRRLMQLNLFAEHIIRKFSEDMSDYKFTSHISMDLEKLLYSISISSAEPGSYFSKKLNAWLLKQNVKSNVSLNVKKGFLNRVRATKAEYSHFESRKLSEQQLRKLTYESD